VPSGSTSWECYVNRDPTNPGLRARSHSHSPFKAETLIESLSLSRTAVWYGSFNKVHYIGYEFEHVIWKRFDSDKDLVVVGWKLLRTPGRRLGRVPDDEGIVVCAKTFEELR
jgi:hypothetical protein